MTTSKLTNTIWEPELIVRRPKKLRTIPIKKQDIQKTIKCCLNHSSVNKNAYRYSSVAFLIYVKQVIDCISKVLRKHKIKTVIIKNFSSSTLF